MEGVFTDGIYHGVDDEQFKIPVSKLEIDRDTQIDLMMQKIDEDSKESPQHEKIMQFAARNVHAVYDYCVQQVEETKNYQKEVLGEDVFKNYSTSGWEDEEGEWHKERLTADGDEARGWELWKMDHSYDQDTLSHFVRVLVNKIKWGL